MQKYGIIKRHIRGDFMANNVKTKKVIDIDKAKIKKELETKQVLDVHNDLVKERRTRITIMSFLLSALVLTAIYGTIQNPFQYTFSKIGNRFTLTNRVFFIVWAAYTGFAIQSTVIALFTLEKYKVKRNYTFIGISSLFLIGTSIAPSLDDFPFWTCIHLITAGLFALFLTLGFYPFIIWVARENPRLRQIIYVWLSIAWGGSITWYFLLGNTGMFEIWFFVFFIVFLLYLSLTLFEEKIVKQSIILLRDEENLNEGIEKIFIDLQEQDRKKKVRRKSKKIRTKINKKRQKLVKQKES